MAQVTKNTSDSEEWSRGQGEFFITSRSTVTNRRTDVTSKTFQSGSNVGSDSESKPTNRPQYTVYRSEDEVPYQKSNNTTAIHVDVRPSHPPVDVAIRRISTTGEDWMVSGEPRNHVYPTETLIVSPPAARTGSRRQRRTLRQGSEARVVTKMTIPPLEPTSLGRPRNQRSYSSDIIRETEATSQRRRQYEQSSLNNAFRQMNLQDQTGRSQSVSRRKKDSVHHHHSRCYGHKHSKIRPSSRSRARDIYGTLRGIPMTIGYTTPTLAFYPDWSGSFAPVSPAAYYYPDDYATPVPGVPYLPSPAIPIHYSLPRRYPPMATIYGPRSGIPMTTVPSMTPGTAQRFPPVYPRSARTPSQYHCVCCPNRAHQCTTEKNSRVFNFEGDQWESEGPTPSNPNQYGRSTLTKRTRSKQQFFETQRMQAQSGMTASMDAGRKLHQTPTEFEVPIQKETPTAMPYGLVSPGGTLNETTYTSQKYQNTWNATLSPKGVVAMPSLHGEVTRDDGFPPDYVDLTDVGIEYTNGMDDGEVNASLPPPDKKVVLQLAESALATANGPTQVAATLKKAMDDNFGPVWHVIAGTGAYGSNIASLGGQLLHFKAFGWAFLIWKTSDQQPE
uniref:Dynein light chain type 1 2 n=1 Tax=Echinococcus granulosus TaxID=6210 RepID=A0A068WH00_ECHGR|nr:Dynein light chain type 1 2 [Echinococcus granulosus]